MNRKIIAGLIILVFLVLSFGASAQDLPETMPNGVAAGDATQTSVVLWTRSTETGTVTFEVATDANITDVVATTEATVEDPLVPVKVLISDLMADTTYFYRVTDAVGSSVVGEFATPAEPGTTTGLRFGVTGDWRGELAPYPAVTNVAGRDLDFFLLHGDTIYSDFPSPDVPLPQATTLEDYHLKHNEVYSERHGLNAFAEVRSSTVIYAVIDDHEVTNDFAGGAPPSYDERFASFDGEFVNDTELYRNGLQAFNEYNPILEESYGDTGDPLTANKPRLYRYRTFGSDGAIFILDSRSFRSEPLPPVQDLTDRAEVTGFLTASLNDERTMLGAPQFEQLQADLLDAQAQGITWKFIMIPEPIQNFGSFNAFDRYEGYAGERAALLDFIEANSISNVVFIAADFHGTVVNDLSYQLGLRDLLSGTHNPSSAFEVITGSVAFDEPFGPTVIRLAAGIGLLEEADVEAYFGMTPSEQDDFITEVINAQVEPFGYSLVGLQDAPHLDVELIEGKYLATNFFGWTEFDIDAETQALTVTTYGITPYDQEELEANAEEIVSRTPEIVSQFVVQPQ
ncbi:MAG: alkaline phosphatase D family protein [Chloroflexi bacterium]|nr:alkaline phosphatase D family protein [Chloroflexota bacterium]